MKSFIARVSLAVLFVVAAGGVGMVIAEDDANEDPCVDISINVSPFCIVPVSEVDYLVVRAEVPYHDVDLATVCLIVDSLNDDPILLQDGDAEAGNNGNLIAKFSYSKVADLAKPKSALIYLVGSKTGEAGGECFIGVDKVNVHDYPRN